MGIYRKEILMQSSGKGTFEITGDVAEGVRESGLADGLASVFVRHTSCSLVLMENADPTARRDLERFMDDLVPDDYPHFIHTYEGPDDMPSHIKMALTRSSETIPFANGRLLLGTWQGIFLWEHRVAPHSRKITLTCVGE
ncbi:MAG: secondary thiamine-phosphate synthase enzyme YjbQ [Verrucomicrobia bacterium]|jgi:secondary thiamine-phosphate synthase enzyme|nr:YjbQ family protein [Verrucomicrobiota bacterium]MDA0725241.1 secondary thiamine-phosphate synthase enzyme YjbQ [Verrucomicrobiota bacterium]MDA1047832.1 secondary thiamine-phosphate synthase enzyme YjbQ [Verrucomicrobiota bacterium]